MRKKCISDSNLNKEAFYECGLIFHWMTWIELVFAKRTKTTKAVKVCQLRSKSMALANLAEH